MFRIFPGAKLFKGAVSLTLGSTLKFKAKFPNSLFINLDNLSSKNLGLDQLEFFFSKVLK